MAKKKGQPAEEGKEPVYAKIDKDARDIIDQYKKKGVKVSTLIEDAIDLYHLYHSLPIAILDKLAPKEVEIEGLNLEIAKHFEVIKSGLDLLEQQEHVDSEVEKTYGGKDLWLRSRDEMKMMLIGKTTFNHLIKAAVETPKNITDQPFRSNAALALINWETKKPIKALSLEEILDAIKKMWVVANYFYIIVIKRDDEEEDKYFITFRHRQRLMYSKYWVGYFTELFTSDAFSSKCKLLDSEAYDEYFTLTIKKVNEK